MGYTVSARKRAVIFDCPHCLNELRSPLEEAGTKQACPTCRQLLDVPGESQAQAIIERERQQQIETQRTAEELAAVKVEDERRLREVATTLGTPAPLDVRPMVKQFLPEITESVGYVRTSAGIVEGIGWVTAVLGGMTAGIGFVMVLGGDKPTEGVTPAIVLGISSLIYGVTMIAAAKFFTMLAFTCEAVRQIGERVVKDRGGS